MGFWWDALVRAGHAGRGWLVYLRQLEAKRQQDAAFIRAIHGAPAPAELGDPPPITGPVDFGGGCRELPPQPPRIVWTRDPDDPAWWSATIVDRKW